MSKFDYLIVGAGLFGSVLPMKQHSVARSALLSTSAITLQATFTPRISRG